MERTEGLIHFCIDEGWKLEELKLLLKNLELQPEEKHDLMVIATTSMKLVQQCINDDVVQNEIMTTETPEETPTATTVTEAEAEVEAVVEAITITPPAPPVLSRYTRKTGNLIPYNKKAFEVKKNGTTRSEKNNTGAQSAQSRAIRKLGDMIEDPLLSDKQKIEVLRVASTSKILRHYFKSAGLIDVPE